MGLKPTASLPRARKKYLNLREIEKAIRDIFNEAEKNALAIISLDEVDSIAQKIAKVTGEVERKMIVQLLSLMDDLSCKNMIVISAKNRPDIIVSASSGQSVLMSLFSFRSKIKGIAGKFSNSTPGKWRLHRMSILKNSFP